MFVDFIQNGQGHGPLGELLHDCHFDPGYLRPFINDRGEKSVLIKKRGPNRWRKDKNGQFITNAKGDKVQDFEEVRVSDLMQKGVNLPVYNTSSLRKDEWILLDGAVVPHARHRLRVWSDLAMANSVNIDGMAHTIFEHETVSDTGNAVMDMDALTEATNDEEQFQLEGMPLPIAHSDFHIDLRKLRVSRNGNTPLDTLRAERAGRRIGELIEDVTLGTVTGLTYGTSTDYGRTSAVYGYTNFPQRLTNPDFTAPTAGGWTPNTTYNEILAAISQLNDQKFYGPWMIYHSTDYSQYLDRVFSDSGGNHPGETLRTMLRKIDNVSDVRRADRLLSSSNPFTFIFVQMTSEVARAIIGMPISVLQWESMGGLRLNFKVMTIMVPQLRADFSGNCGILEGTTA